IKMKGSRFLAEALPAADEAAAEAAISAIRKREYNATHHCTAYRIGPAADLFRFNDDGEPSGTAGQPILRQIEGRELTNTLVVVTRYYGGTKLGTGGLIRAYGEAASLALDASPVQQCILRERLRLHFGYDDTSPAMHTISQFDAKIQETHYSDATEMIVGVRRSQVDGFRDLFTNALSGRGSITRVEG
ncbi:MAG TPA: YigZ family protein, partial [Rhodothermales bacterium]|nr:YigZ family protein [Rhodothermales bacterium]